MSRSPAAVAPPEAEDARWQIGIDQARHLRRERPKRKRSTVRKIYAVPRQFDLASLLVVSLAYSLLFGCLAVFQAVWPFYLFFGGLTVVVAVMQGFYPYGNGPRWVSMITGAIYFLVACIAFSVIYGEVALAIFGVVGSITLGPVLGYFFGAVEAGVFLLADRLRKRWAAPLPDRPDGADSPFD